MTRIERENWLINIENSATFIATELGVDAVNSILKNYGTENIESIPSTDLPEIFSEIYAIETDLRSG